MQETHAEKACRLFSEGMNCAQSVFVAFCDVTGLDEETAMRLSSSFGAGMGMILPLSMALRRQSTTRASRSLPPRSRRSTRRSCAASCSGDCA